MQNVRLDEDSVEQSKLIRRMDQFLKQLGTGERIPEWAFEGLCAGFSNMKAFALLINQEEQYMHRIDWLGQSDDNIIMQAAYIFKNYRNEVPNVEKIMENFNKIQRPIDKTKAEAYYQQNKQKFLNKFNKKFRIKIDTHQLIEIYERAKDIYYFINVLLAAFFPERELGLEGIGQADLTLMASLIAPVELVDPTLIKNTYRISFNFTESELETIFSRIDLSNNEVGRLGSSDHAMLLQKKGGKFVLTDPNGKKGPVTVDTIKDLVDKIKEFFFTEFGKDTHYMPIVINLFSLDKSSQKSEAEMVSRPSPTGLVEDILTKRKEMNVDISKSWDGNTSLWLAARSGDIEIAKLLLNKGADPSGIPRAYLTRLLRIVFENNDRVKKNQEFIRVLLENGADPSCKLIEKDNYGKTPFQVALEEKSYDTAKMFCDKTVLDVKEQNAIAFFEIIAKTGDEKVNAFVLNQMLNRGQFVTMLGVGTRLNSSATIQAGWKIAVDEIEKRLEGGYVLFIAKILANLPFREEFFTPELQQKIASHHKKIFDKICNSDNKFHLLQACLNDKSPLAMVMASYRTEVKNEFDRMIEEKIEKKDIKKSAPSVSKCSTVNIFNSMSLQNLSINNDNSTSQPVTNPVQKQILELKENQNDNLTKKSSDPSQNSNGEPEQKHGVKIRNR